MGSDQSRTTDPSNDDGRPPDYYELLQVDQDATDDEIKASVVLRLGANEPTDTRKHTAN